MSVVGRSSAHENRISRRNHDGIEKPDKIDHSLGHIVPVRGSDGTSGSDRYLSRGREFGSGVDCIRVCAVVIVVFAQQGVHFGDAKTSIEEALSS